MNCVVTAGPTYETLDNVRRLTNFSTGRLGSDLAAYLAARGHEVTLLLGDQATHRPAQPAFKLENYSTTDDLATRLRAHARGRVDAVFHAAAVSDYKFGRIWIRSAAGELTEARSGKISTREGTLLAELVPTMKIIASLREWFPDACLVGWKYEVDRDRAGVLDLAERQMRECRTNACVANGRAYGLGFGLVTAPGQCQHLRDPQELYAGLERLGSSVRPLGDLRA